MPWPVTVHGTTYNEADFSGLGYLTAFPDSLSKLADAQAFARGGASTTSVTLGTGLKTFTIGFSFPSLATLPANERIWMRAYANSTNYMEGYVQSYNSGTGQVTLNVAAAANVKGSGTFASWTIVFLTRVSTTYPGESSVSDLVPLGADSGGTGMMASIDDARVGFMLPMPGSGYSFSEEFYPRLPAFSGQAGNARSLWVYRTTQDMGSYTGALSTKLVGVAVVAPYKASNDPGLADIPIPLALGTQGYLSPGSPGDLHFAALVGFEGTTFSVSGGATYWMGLRGEASSYTSIFDKYGIGFEMKIVSGDAVEWYGVVTVAGVQTKALLYTGAYAFCAVWVDSFAKQAWLYAGSTPPPSPSKTDSYGMVADVSSWPAHDPSFFVHPAAAIAQGSSASPQVMYVDRISLYKALER